ncbi:MAG: hypothetical protein DMG97_16175, partial [Acidobacteria bacterium]
MVGYLSWDYFSFASNQQMAERIFRTSQVVRNQLLDRISRLAVSLGIHNHHLAGRNLFTAKVVSTIKSSKTKPCATANGGSFCVGAIALSDGTFSNDCTTKTKTLKYNATHVAIT